jgi:preprotein translocase subunit SecA
VSTLRSLKRFQRLRAKRETLEKKTKILEENARKAKLSIDKELLVQVLQEENRSHEDTIKELAKQLQEENSAHQDAIKELKEKIADLEKQIKSSSEEESVPAEMPSESEQEMAEPPQETSTEIDEQAEADPYHQAGALLKDSEAAPEVPKKKRRDPF